MPPGADSTKRLIRLVLAGFGAPDALVLAASALVGLSQVLSLCWDTMIFYLEMHVNLLLDVGGACLSHAFLM